MVDVAASFIPRLSASGPFLEGLTFFGLTSCKFVDPATIVPLAQQTGTPEHPFSSLAPAIDALPAGGGTLFCAPAQTYPAEALTIVSKKVAIYSPTNERVGAPDLSLVTFNSNAALGFSNIEGIGAIDIGALAPLALENTTTTQPIACGTIHAQGSTVQDLAAQGSVLNDMSSCIANGVVTINGLTRLTDCQFLSTLDLARGLFANDSFFVDNLTVVGNASIRSSSFGNNVSISGGLFIDSATYWGGINLGRAITYGSIVVLDAGPGEKQFAWNPSTDPDSNVLQLLGAVHPGGIYQINVAIVVHANATAFTDVTPRISVNGVSQDLPAVSGAALTAGAAGRQALGPTSQLIPPFNVRSLGLAAVTAQLITTGATGAPNFDVVASATLLSQQ